MSKRHATLDLASARSHAIGPGRVLAVGYGFFTLAAGARSIVQISTHFGRAPLAYLLSGLAALIYACAAVLIVAVDRQPDPDRLRIARNLCLLEIVGVIVIGTASLLCPAGFPDATVWSAYGSGYGFVPAGLPLLALGWLHRRPGEAATTALQTPR